MSTEEVTHSTDPFPLDWNEFRRLWSAWLADVQAGGQLARFKGRTPFKGKNFMADEIIGVFHGPEWGVLVELSEVKMPDFGARPQRDVRYIGVTFGNVKTGETWVPEPSGLAASFAGLAAIVLPAGAA